MWLSFVYFAFFVICFSVFSQESLPGDDVLCRLLSRPLPSVCFLPCLFILLCSLRPCSFPVCFGVTPSILYYSWISSGSVVFGNLEGAVRRGRGGKEKEWIDCVQSDIRAFGIAEDWKAMGLMAEVWVETITERGRRFMAAWRIEEVDAARHRQEKREATRLGNLLPQTGV